MRIEVGEYTPDTIDECETLEDDGKIIDKPAGYSSRAHGFVKLDRSRSADVRSRKQAILTGQRMHDGEDGPNKPKSAPEPRSISLPETDERVRSFREKLHQARQQSSASLQKRNVMFKTKFGGSVDVLRDRALSDTSLPVQVQQPRSMFTKIFRPGNKVDPQHPDCRVMPKASVSFLNAIRLKRLGYNFYGVKWREFQSSVYQINLGTPRIVICDWKGIQAMFDPDNIIKEPRFGIFQFNSEILDQYTPTFFSNEEEHTKKKMFVTEYMRLVNTEDMLDRLSFVTSSELRKLPLSTYFQQGNFEEALKISISNIFSEIILGKTVDAQALILWQLGSLRRSIKPPVKDNEKYVAAYRSLLDAIQDAPNVGHMRMKAGHLGIKEEDIAKEVLFFLIFNGYAALQSLAISCVAYVINLSTTDRNRLKKEAQVIFSTKLTRDVIARVPYLEGFVLEVLRLHPPAYNLFGRAKRDFVLESTTGKFPIKQNQTLCGCLYEAHRDHALFDQPNEMQLERYMNDSYLRRFVMTFGGAFNEPATLLNHHCPGQNTAFLILKLFVANLLFCDIEVRQPPRWTGRKITRQAGSDQPLQVTKFELAKW